MSSSDNIKDEDTPSNARVLRAFDGLRPSVNGLRDQYLSEAMMERRRCFDFEAAERRRMEFRGMHHAATQTDPVDITQSHRLLTAPSAAPIEVASTSCSWSKADDEAQTEALQTIKLLSQRQSQPHPTENRAAMENRVAIEKRVAALEAELLAERAGREELDARFSYECSTREAAHEQTLCLEAELDTKEGCLQDAEHQLDQCKAELKLAQLHLNILRGESAFSTTGRPTSKQDALIKELSAQLLDRELQMQFKDQRIARLSDMLEQHYGQAADDSTVCEYEGIMATSTATTATT